MLPTAPTFVPATRMVAFNAQPAGSSTDQRSVLVRPSAMLVGVAVRVARAPSAHVDKSLIEPPEPTPGAAEAEDTPKAITNAADAQQRNHACDMRACWAALGSLV